MILGTISLAYGQLEQPLQLPNGFTVIERRDYYVVVFTPDRRPHLVEIGPETLTLFPITGFSVGPSADLEAAVNGQMAQVTSVNTKAALVIPKQQPKEDAR